MKSATPTLVAVMALLTIAVSSCRAPAPFEQGRFVELLEHPNLGLQLDTLHEIDSSVTAKYPLVQLKAHVLTGDMTILDELGLSAAPLQCLSSASEQALLKAAENNERLKTIGSPRVLVNSGQSARVLVVQQVAYIKDIEFVQAKEESDKQELNPVVGTLNTGYAIELEPTIEPMGPDGQEITLRDTRLDLVRHLGSRVCRAQVGWGEGALWEEPVLLVGEQHENIPETIKIKAGQAILMRMQFRVEQGCANVRAYVRGIHVEELVYNPSKDFAPGEPSFRNGDCVVLVNCEIIKSEEELLQREESWPGTRP